MKKTLKQISVLFTVVGGLAIGSTSCVSDPNSPGLEYMPDMYRSPAFEAYSGNGLYADSMASRLPAEGTIARGHMPYMLQNTPEDYEKSATMNNPLPYSPEIVKEGKVVYDKMCTQCHGKDGQGDGPVATNPKWPGPPPPYNGRIKDLPAGKIFFSITYGKGLMGAHYSQISQEDRWKLTYYIEKLQGKDLDALYGVKVAESTEELVEEEMNNEIDAAEEVAAL